MLIGLFLLFQIDLNLQFYLKKGIQKYNYDMQSIDLFLVTSSSVQL